MKTRHRKGEQLEGKEAKIRETWNRNRSTVTQKWPLPTKLGQYGGDGRACGTASGENGDGRA
ncbi:uncharacterized protein G2W53_003785 [Senna tora]|uniref:Uncharacterized protein n=1 Tax=Senna tora TaxID=362788 RepID=A0A835CJK6_9FABA|nr:uncharacterized protein G2W53_003785 [Senna tora]